MESRTSPGKRGSVQPISGYLAGVFQPFLAWVSRLVGLVWLSVASSVSGVSV